MLASAALAMAWTEAGLARPQAYAPEEKIPLIVIDNVPLTDAIRNLARQMELNYILDSRIMGRKGLFAKEPSVSYRWENLTAEEGLRRVLKDHKLKMVLSPATSVARIVGTNIAAVPVPASEVGTDSKGPIPLVQMDSMPVSEAIKQLAKHSGINILFAPPAQAALENPGGSREAATISLRWRNITGRQALAALLDNYDLMLVEDATKPVARIELRTRIRK